jgi:membrane protease subunit HflK
MFDRLVEFLLQCLGLFKAWEIVDCYQKGVVLRFGRHVRNVGPGFHWVWPFGVERVLHANIVPNTTNLGVQSLTTKDGHQVVISGLLTWRVADPTKFLLEVEGGQDAVADITFCSIADSVQGSTWEQVSDPDFPAKTATKLRRRAGRYGIEIDRLQFSDLSKCRSLRLWNAAH